MTVERKSGAFAPADIAEPALAASSIDIDPRLRRSRARRLRLPLLMAAPILALAIALLIYLRGGRYETTDNGSIQSGLVSIAATVSGPVVAVEVRENQRVSAGQVLFRIEPAPYRTAVEGAEAALATARAQIATRRADYSQGQALLQAARSRLDYATREAGRQKALLGEGISSQAQYDQARLAVETAAQEIETSRQKNIGVAASLSGDVGAPIDRQPGVRSAQAALDQARLNLSHTIVRASQDGVVTKVNQLQVGDYVTAAKPVFTLAGTDLWIEANFKENQLRHMRIGQPARFRIDAFPDLDLTGRLVSFSPGTGNSFALLPAENATGNWVKVVQRLPVEFGIDKIPAGTPLHAGLSVTVTVDTGYRRQLFAATAR